MSTVLVNYSSGVSDMRYATVHRLQSPATPWGRLSDATGTTFQEAMRQLPSGVCVVTHGTGGERTGLTATSVASLSSEPPALLVCLHRSSSSDPALTRLGAFAVNVLAADQREIAGRFASASGVNGEERFEEGRWVAAPERDFLSCRFGRGIRLRSRRTHRAARPCDHYRTRAARADRQRLGRPRLLARILRSGRMEQRRDFPRSGRSLRPATTSRYAVASIKQVSRDHIVT